LSLMFFGVYAKEGIEIFGFFALAFVFATIFSTVSLLRHKRNKIFVTATQEDLYIDFRPSNFSKDVHYKVKNIEQLFVKVDQYGLGLHMVVNSSAGQKQERLISRFKNITHAKYIEQELEKYLGITNKSVPGEHK